MTNTLNQIILFPPPKSEYFFQQHCESEYPPPLQVKWLLPNDIGRYFEGKEASPFFKIAITCAIFQLEGYWGYFEHFMANCVRTVRLF